MRRAILYSALALVIGAILLRLMQHDAGYLLIVAGGKTVEMRLGFALVLLILGLMVLLLARRGWRMITGGWRHLVGNKDRKAIRYNQLGWQEYLAGDWRPAQKHLYKAARLSEDPVAQYLAAARCAAELGRDKKAQVLLQKAERQSPPDSLAIALTRARLQFQSGDYEPCLQTLERAKTIAPHHPATLDLLQQTYTAQGDWQQLEELLPALKQAKVLSETRWQALEAEVFYQQQCYLANRFEHPQSPHPTLDEVHDLWERLPKNLKSEIRFVARQARLLMALQAYQEAEALLHTALTKNWSETLVTLYGNVPAPDALQQLKNAEKWLGKHPHNAELHLALGRICLRNQLWGQAKDHLQTSIHLRPQPAAYAELGHLLARLGDDRQSALSYQEGLALSNQFSHQASDPADDALKK